MCDRSLEFRHYNSDMSSEHEMSVRSMRSNNNNVKQKYPVITNLVISGNLSYVISDHYRY